MVHVGHSVGTLLDLLPSFSSSLDELVLDPVPLELSSSFALSSSEELEESLNLEDFNSLEPFTSPGERESKIDDFYIVLNPFLTFIFLSFW